MPSAHSSLRPSPGIDTSRLGSTGHQSVKGGTNSKARARALIAKFAGPTYAKKAIQSKWILDLVAHLEDHCHAELEAQIARAEAAEAELQKFSVAHNMSQHRNTQRNDALEERAWKAEQRALVAESKWAQAQCELSHVQDCMREAAAAAAAGAAECAKLQLAFAELSEEERRQKKALANRSYENRMSLNTTRAQLREHRGKARAQAIQLEQLHQEAQTAIMDTDRRREEAEALADKFIRVNRRLERKVAALSNPDLVAAMKRRRPPATAPGRARAAEASPQPSTSTGTGSKSSSAQKSGSPPQDQPPGGAAVRFAGGRLLGYNSELYQ